MKLFSRFGDSARGSLQLPFDRHGDKPKQRAYEAKTEFVDVPVKAAKHALKSTRQTKSTAKSS